MAFYLRPVISSPRYCAPAIFSRPTFPTPHDVAPLFSLFDETFAQLERVHRQSKQHFKRPFNPKFDVKETKEAYTVEGELPGFNAKDLSIEFLDDGHTLQIKGKTVRETRQQQLKAVEAAQAEAPKAVETAPASTETKSDTGSVKSHQPTVEDDAEEPGNASAVAQPEEAQPEEAQPQQQEQTQAVADSAKAAEQPAAEQQQEDARQLISERYSGSFSRSFKFPSKVNQEAVRASLKDGILAITLPFARKPESRRIRIE